MILYKYRPYDEHIKDNIGNNRFIMSSIDNLNDPFEMLCHVKGQNTNKYYYRIENYQYIIGSFSKNWNNILMWNMYSNNFKGVCFELEIDDSLINTEYPEVIYSNEKHEILVRDEKSITTLENGSLYFPRVEIDDIPIESIYRKHLNWKYEEEVRIVRKIDDEHQIDWFLKVKKINQIYVGYNISRSHFEQLKELALDHEIKLRLIQPNKFEEVLTSIEID